MAILGMIQTSRNEYSLFGRGYAVEAWHVIQASDIQHLSLCLNFLHDSSRKGRCPRSDAKCIHDTDIVVCRSLFLSSSTHPCPNSPQPNSMTFIASILLLTPGLPFLPPESAPLGVKAWALLQRPTAWCTFLGAMEVGSATLVC